MDKRVLLLLAGVMWIGVGIMLIKLAYGWLSAVGDRGAFPSAAAGIALALAIHHFGFLKVVDKNLGRILPGEGKRCIFAFISWKSYLLIGVMVMLGIGLLRKTSSHQGWQSGQRSSLRPWKLYRQGVLTNVLNPKVALFFLSFLPQFVDPQTHFVFLPFLLLGLSFFVTGSLYCVMLVYASAWLTRRFSGPSPWELWSVK